MPWKNIGSQTLQRSQQRPWQKLLSSSPITLHPQMMCCIFWADMLERIQTGLKVFNDIPHNFSSLFFMGISLSIPMQVVQRPVNRVTFKAARSPIPQLPIYWKNILDKGACIPLWIAQEQRQMICLLCRLFKISWANLSCLPILPNQLPAHGIYSSIVLECNSRISLARNRVENSRNQHI